MASATSGSAEAGGGADLRGTAGTAPRWAGMPIEGAAGRPLSRASSMTVLLLTVGISASLRDFYSSCRGTGDTTGDSVDAATRRRPGARSHRAPSRTCGGQPGSPERQPRYSVSCGSGVRPGQHGARAGLLEDLRVVLWAGARPLSSVKKTPTLAGVSPQPHQRHVTPQVWSNDPETTSPKYCRRTRNYLVEALKDDQNRCRLVGTRVRFTTSAGGIYSAAGS